MKPLLMDQKFISGLGNIYSDEVLFARGPPVRPHVATRCLRRRSGGCTARSRRSCRTRSGYRGTTLDDEAYVDLFGKPGEYQNELKVYGRKPGLPCRRCRTPIESVKLSQRRSFYCPQCQS